jgi:hypothetical protein
LSSLQLFQGVGWIFWVMVVIMTTVIWKKNLPIGMRSAMLVLLVCWLGRLYQVGYTNLAAWPPMITFAYVVLRYLVGLGGLFALFDIIIHCFGVLEFVIGQRKSLLFAIIFGLNFGEGKN